MDEISRTRENRVYRNLTDGRSIIRYFFDDGFTVIGNWDLVSFYLRKVRNMEERRISTIKNVADQFLEFCKSTGSAKRILQLHYARSYRDFRSTLLKVQEAFVKKEGKPLLGFDEYVLDLAPEGGKTWQETRDLLLFRIYEKGASWLSTKKEELDIVDADDVDDTDEESESM